MFKPFNRYYKIIIKNDIFHIKTSISYSLKVLIIDNTPIQRKTQNADNDKEDKERDWDM